MKYFAYGSNMSLARLRDRVPGAERLGQFILVGHDLRFHKQSKDGSGKCDAFLTENPKDSIFGALFEINPFEKPALDIVEGLGYGYQQKTVTVYNNEGVSFEAITYYAMTIDSTLKPYSWYLNHVLIGAREIGVEQHYINNILAVEAIEDPDKKRDALERALHGCSK